MIELVASEESKAVSTLLDRIEDDEAALSALLDDGWGDVHATGGGEWEYFDAAVAAIGSIARARRDVALMPQLLARAALSDADAELPERVALAIDPVRAAAAIDADLWLVPGARSAVVGALDGTMWLAPLDASATIGEPVSLDVSGAVRRVRFDADALTPLASPTGAAERHLAGVAALLAVDALAAVEGAVADTVDHVANRKQFGAPLGELQVVQHRLVDMYGVVVLGRAMIDRLARSVATDEFARAAWWMKSFTDRHTVTVAEQAIQLHGAMGFTWETGLHLVLRRAQRNRQSVRSLPEAAG